MWWSQVARNTLARLDMPGIFFRNKSNCTVRKVWQYNKANLDKHYNGVEFGALHLLIITGIYNEILVVIWNSE